MNYKLGVQHLKLRSKRGTVHVERCGFDGLQSSIPSTARRDGLKPRLLDQPSTDPRPKVTEAPNNDDAHVLLGQVASAAAPKPSISIPCEQLIERIAPALRNKPRRVNHSPQSAQFGDHMYRGVRLGQLLPLIQNEERRGILGIYSVFD